MSWPQATEGIRNRLRLYLGSYARVVLAWRLRLDPSWPPDRWLDSIEELSLSIDGASGLKAEGVLWWGLLSNIAGAQTSEPFEGAFSLLRAGRRLAYELSFGAGGERRHFVRRDLTKG